MELDYTFDYGRSNSTFLGEYDFNYKPDYLEEKDCFEDFMSETYANDPQDFFKLLKDYTQADLDDLFEEFHNLKETTFDSFIRLVAEDIIENSSPEDELPTDVYSNYLDYAHDYFEDDAHDAFIDSMDEDDVE